MKKILAILAVAASMTAVNAQAQNKEVAAAKSAVEKAQAAVENAKQNTKTATWLKYGEALVKAFDAPAGNAWVGMSAQELAVLAGGEKPQSESQVTLGGQPMTKQVFANKNLYFNQNGQLAVIEITQPVVENALDKAVEASRMLFGGNSESLKKLDERTFLAVFADVPSFDIDKADLPCNIMDFLAVKTAVLPSKGEARKMIQGGGIAINKDKVTDIAASVTEEDIVNGHYILAQKGKKNYFIINVK